MGTKAKNMLLTLFLWSLMPLITLYSWQHSIHALNKQGALQACKHNVKDEMAKNLCAKARLTDAITDIDVLSKDEWSYLYHTYNDELKQAVSKKAKATIKPNITPKTSPKPVSKDYKYGEDNESLYF